MNWNKFKAKLIERGLTIKQWCKDNAFDYERYKNLRAGLVKIKEEEKKLFDSVLKWGE